MKRRGFLKSLAGLLAAPAALAAMPTPVAAPAPPVSDATYWADLIKRRGNGQTLTFTSTSNYEGVVAYVPASGNEYPCTHNGAGIYSVTIPASETR